MTLKSIRRTAQDENIPENFLRQMVRSNGCPGVYSGRKFLVDVDALRVMLAEQAAAAVKKTQTN